MTFSFDFQNLLRLPNTTLGSTKDVQLHDNVRALASLIRARQQLTEGETALKVLDKIIHDTCEWVRIHCKD